MHQRFGLWDWAVVAAVFALTTWIGRRMAGKPATFREFFLGGKRLPWYAVAGSIISTEISAVTLISLPATVFVPGGDLQYLQLGIIGSFVARWLIALFLVPAFYEREIYSPYDYMGARLGEGVRRTTTLLFTVGGVLGQASRLYLTGLVLEVILHDELARVTAVTGISGLALALGALGVVSVVWTWMGGIATVVWTDVVLFLVFLAAAAISLAALLGHVDGGVAGVVQAAEQAGKLRWLDFSPRLDDDFTFWAALFASGLGGLGQYGTDQLMAQRIFCCKSARDAQKAVVASYGAMLVVVCVSFIGLALFAYYAQHPLTGEWLASYAESSDRIFPIFVVTVIDTPLKGLIVAGIFAAASPTSILAALSQTTMSAFRRAPAQGAAVDEKRALFVSRALVLFFGVLLCGAALACERLVGHYGTILKLALAMPAYTQGAVLAAFVLAFLPLRLSGDGYPWAALVAVLSTFCLAWRQPVAVWAQGIAASAIFVAWIALRLCARGGARDAGEWGRTALLAAVLALAPWLCASGRIGAVSWVWYVLLGAAIAVPLGIALDRGRAPTRAAE